jgi:hypothetical protein
MNKSIIDIKNIPKDELMKAYKYSLYLKKAQKKYYDNNRELLKQKCKDNYEKAKNDEEKLERRRAGWRESAKRMYYRNKNLKQQELDQEFSNKINEEFNNLINQIKV